MTDEEHGEHPDDRKEREDGERYGRIYGPEFVADHVALVSGMIATYADADAERLFHMLRDLFWSGLWQPKDGGKLAGEAHK